MINQLTSIAHQAGQLVCSIYQRAFEVMNKQDNSVLTEADLVSHTFICDALMKQYPDIPIISEESAETLDYDKRKAWEYFFLVDPLDGTKEFIKRNGEFTINIALVKKDLPILGIIHAPALDLTYYAEKDKGAYKLANQQLTPLLAQAKTPDQLRVITSRSHACDKTQAFLEALKSEGKDIQTQTIGSALKFGLIAEGKADIYPRLAPTKEWDTAAGQIIVNEVGKQVNRLDNHQPLQYNKRELKNPEFIVQ
jgi:3'(2'), 5'-bisphosphate nucleotidase